MQVDCAELRNGVDAVCASYVLWTFTPQAAVLEACLVRNGSKHFFSCSRVFLISASAAAPPAIAAGASGAGGGGDVFFAATPCGHL